MHYPIRTAGLLAALAFSAPSIAQAQEGHCKHTAQRELSLELAGAKTVVFEVGSNTLRLTAAPGQTGALRGRACAATADRLEGLTLSQKRVGDKLIVTLHDDRPLRLSFGNSYSYLDMAGSVPDTLPVQLKVGSGDASVTGAPVLSVDVGSGDAVARGIRGLAAASVGSGDIELHDVGSLNVISIGSGEVKAHGVRGDVKVGSIGSGSFDVTGVGGDVGIGSIGSGDADVRDVEGSVAVDSIGSGDVEARTVGGGLKVRSVGSGSIHHDGVRGPIDTPKKK